jgi:hypothetical protein
MKQKVIICKCGKEFISSTAKSKFCPECKLKNSKAYHTSYNALYNKTRRYSDEPKRKYIRTALKNKSRNTSAEAEYCKQGNFDIKACLNCICVECIQKENDDLLPWEKEEFYEDNYQIKF